MASTSQKFADFIREPMKDKPVSDLAGIGAKTATELKGHGITKAYHLLGQFLTFDKDKEMFDSFLQDNAPGLQSRWREQTYDCLNEWCENNL